MISLKSVAFVKMRNPYKHTNMLLLSAKADNISNEEKIKKCQKTFDLIIEYNLQNSTCSFLTDFF